MKILKTLSSLSAAGVVVLSAVTSARADLNSPYFIRVGESYTFAMDPSNLATSETITVVELSGSWVKVKSAKNGTYWLNTAIVVAIQPVGPK